VPETEAHFEIVPPAGARRPFIAHVPHASIRIPPFLRPEILLGDEELADEVLRLTDWYTDDLFGRLADHGATLFVNRLSRLVFDPERFVDDESEPMAARGQGVVYWRGTRGQSLRRPDLELRARRIDESYRPYHAVLDSLVGEMLEASGTCTLLDCHSFSSVPLPSEIDQASDRPDICIGTDPVHTPAAMAEAMVAAFRAEGFRVERDTPFSGTFVPGGSHGRDTRVRSVMIEVRRGLYIDEVTAERRSDYEEVRRALVRAVSSQMSSLEPLGG
jgi:N-formylglutamate deformylase